MLKTVRFVSQLLMEHHIKPSKDLAVISITDPGSVPASFRDAEFNSALRLQFDDLYEELINEPVGSIPDVNFNEEKLLWHGFQLPDLMHAQKIVNFLRVVECQHVVVHCHAGISRSAAVAQFIADQYGAKLIEEHGDTLMMNQRMFRLLNKVHCDEEVLVGRYISRGEMATVGDHDDFDLDLSR